MAHAPDTCVMCGQTDDHPKFHVTWQLPGGDLAPVKSMHHDCIPAHLLDQNDHVPHLRAIADAARSGVRGDALRAHIANGGN